MISGTFGLSAGVDSYLIMLRQSQAYRLHAGGRLWDRDEHDYAIERDAGRWNLTGEWDATVSSMPPKQRAILDLLADGAKTNRALEVVSRVGVIRPPGVGIFRPVGGVPKCISKHSV
jgi:hypothetical protein